MCVCVCDGERRQESLCGVCLPAAGASVHACAPPMRASWACVRCIVFWPLCCVVRAGDMCHCACYPHVCFGVAWNEICAHHLGCVARALVLRWAFRRNGWSGAREWGAMAACAVRPQFHNQNCVLDVLRTSCSWRVENTCHPHILFAYWCCSPSLISLALTATTTTAT